MKCLIDHSRFAYAAGRRAIREMRCKCPTRPNRTSTARAHSLEIVEQPTTGYFEPCFVHLNEQTQTVSRLAIFSTQFSGGSGGVFACIMQNKQRFGCVGFRSLVFVTRQEVTFHKSWTGLMTKAPVAVMMGAVFGVRSFSTSRIQ